MLFRAGLTITVMVVAAVFAMSGCSSDSHGGSASEAGGAATPDATGGTTTDAASDAAAEPVDATVLGRDAALPAIDGAARVVTLTEAQQGVLCDWAVAEWGGYGTTVPCSGGNSRSNPANQATCLMNNTPTNPDCALTVSQLEMCVLASAPSGGCNTSSSTCMLVFECDLGSY